ncbi:unnamed protein product [Schistocephalus solidus]|uniref:Secreted protein n=1 Tax=Schistocephalus solidus TaxID=70667 RepID=A0A183SHF1_SCHSO|nr:unnamed protein product [Schistocephalus solidus]
MLLWPPRTGSQLSPVAPRSWVLPSGHTPGNRHDRRTKPGEVLRCYMCLQTRYVCCLPLLCPLSLPPCPFLSSSSPLPSFFYPSPSSRPFSLLSLLLSFTLTSSLLPRSSPFPPPTRSKNSYGEGYMQSHMRPRRIGRAITYQNRDT